MRLTKFRDKMRDYWDIGVRACIVYVTLFWSQRFQQVQKWRKAFEIRSLPIEGKIADFFRLCILNKWSEITFV